MIALCRLLAATLLVWSVSTKALSAASQESDESRDQLFPTREVKNAWSAGAYLQAVDEAQGVALGVQTHRFLPMKSALRLNYSRLGIKESDSFDMIELLWINFLTPPGRLWKARTYYALGVAATRTSEQGFHQNESYPIEVALGVEFGPAEVVPTFGRVAPTLGAAYMLGKETSSPIDIANEFKLQMGLRYYF